MNRGLAWVKDGYLVFGMDIIVEETIVLAQMLPPRRVNSPDLSYAGSPSLLRKEG